MPQPTHACSWYEYRFNIVAFGVIGHSLPSQFVDSLETAKYIRVEMAAIGAEDIRIYDTVDGVFH